MHNLAYVQEVTELRKRHLQNCNDLWTAYEESQDKGIFPQKEANVFEWSNLWLFESLALADLFFFLINSYLAPFLPQSTIQDAIHPLVISAEPHHALAGLDQGQRFAL